MSKQKPASAAKTVDELIKLVVLARRAVEAAYARCQTRTDATASQDYILIQLTQARKLLDQATGLVIDATEEEEIQEAAK